MEFGTPSQVQGERAGQLYAYRINTSAVVLSTRDNVTLGAAVGIKTVANGMYRCDARNDNENRTVFLKVNVTCKLNDHCC